MRPGISKINLISITPNRNTLRILASLRIAVDCDNVEDVMFSVWAHYSDVWMFKRTLRKEMND